MHSALELLLAVLGGGSVVGNMYCWCMNTGLLDSGHIFQPRVVTFTAHLEVVNHFPFANAANTFFS